MNIEFIEACTDAYSQPYQVTARCSDKKWLTMHGRSDHGELFAYFREMLAAEEHLVELAFLDLFDNLRM